MMTKDKLKQWRKKRLQDFVDAFGEAKKAGQALGYKDGGFIGQMIEGGSRPISEKTVEKVESLAGFEGWFDVPPDASQSTYTRVHPARKNTEFSPSAEELAKAFDAIPVSQNLYRIKAFNAASMAILEVLQELKSKGHVIPGLEK